MKLKKYLVFWFIGLLIIGLIISASCSSGVIETSEEEEIETPTQAVGNVTAREAYNLILENSHNPDFIIIDVRTPEEYGEGHIEGAVNMDFYAPDFSDQIGGLDTGKTYLLHCRSGGRSGQALVIMEEKNFLRIYHMNGGMLEWTAEGLPTVK